MVDCNDSKQSLLKKQVLVGPKISFTNPCDWLSTRAYRGFIFLGEKIPFRNLYSYYIWYANM